MQLTTSLSNLPEVGQIVRLRARQYLVDEVIRPADTAFATHVRLSCLDDDAQGEPLEVLWECELDAEILEASWDRLAHPSRPFDPPTTFSAYLSALRWNLVSATDARIVQAPFRAGIQTLHYQLEPLRKALALPRVNLFIADDVGLGKTIEAGLILRELMMRQKVKKIVIGAPANVTFQWKTELEERFGLTFEILDRDYVMRIKTERGHRENAWKTHSRFIVSHALLRDETYLKPLREALDPQRTRSVIPQTMLVLDEAHNAAPASDGAYAVDSNFTRSIRELAQTFEHRLFLSATPHNGLSNSFSALLEILDPLRFTRGTAVTDKAQLKAVMVRRLKRDLAHRVPGFPIRKVEAIKIPGADHPELQLFSALERYRELRIARLKLVPHEAQVTELLALTGLQKFLLSSISAFARPLEKYLESLEAALDAPSVAPSGPIQGRLPTPPPAPPSAPQTGSSDSIDPNLDPVLVSELDDTDPLTEADEADDFELLKDDLDLRHVGKRKILVPTQQELDVLTALLERALEHKDNADSDPRVAWLVSFVKTTLTKDRRLVIFTEYTTTMRYLADALSAALGPDTIATLSGSFGAEARQHLARRFNAPVSLIGDSDEAGDPLRVLIATDAAREGINLQARCADLVHFDLPWNPSRLEQRNGRIDRRLQPDKTVTCRYFTYDERPSDRVLAELVTRTDTIASELGTVPAVLERDIHRAMVMGFGLGRPTTIIDLLSSPAADSTRRLQTQLDELDANVDPVTGKRTDRAALEIETQLDELGKLYADSKRKLDFSELDLQTSISVALQLLGQPPLTQLSPDSDGAPRFAFPPLDLTDRSWANTLDSLRPMRDPASFPEDKDFFEWRKKPLRPVRFVPSDKMDPSVVHLHLEHRVVQRLLNRFLAQGFGQHDLARVCLAQPNDGRSRVLLIGRLSLFGPNASRLHDELVLVAAPWSDPIVRKNEGRVLEPYKTEATDRAFEDMKAALTSPRKFDIPPQRMERIRDCLALDLEELRPALAQRLIEAEGRARALLQQRGAKESGELATIIKAQRDRLKAERSAAELADKKLLLPLSDDEQRQRQADIRLWGERIVSLERELEIEPEKVLGAYTIEAVRTEPVGLVYLLPVGG